MLPERRDTEWRPVATARVPAHWLGLLAASATGLPLILLIHKFGYPIYIGAAALGVFVTNRVAARRLAHLRDEGDDRQFAATLRLRRGCAYGHDEGLVAFEDGYLVFMGRRCAFSLGAADVSAVTTEPGKLKFAFPGPAGEYTAEITTTRSEGFGKAMARWKADAARSASPVLPPVHPDPNLPLPLVVAAETLPVAAVAVAAYATMPPGFFERLFVLALAVFVPLYAVRLFVVLRRIDREEPRPPSPLARLRRRRDPEAKGLPSPGE